jgi:hypothetical protein
MALVDIKATGGDWKWVPNLVRKMKESVFGSKLDRTTRKVARFIAAEIREGIESGAPGGDPFEPLSEHTIRRKGHSRPGLWTFALIKSIEARKVSKANYTIGPTEDEPHPRPSTRAPTIRQVAEIFEDGSDTQPPRPFIQPVLDAIEDDIREMFGEGIDAAIDPRRR